MSRRRRLGLAVVVVLLLVVALAVGDALRGDLTVADRGRTATAWSAGCYLRPPRTDRDLIARCARVTGRVVYVSKEPGRRLDVHAAVIVDFGVVLVKMLDPPAGAMPAVGDRITAVGPMVRARNGMREVQGFAVGDPLRPVVERYIPR